MRFHTPKDLSQVCRLFSPDHRIHPGRIDVGDIEVAKFRHPHPRLIKQPNNDQLLEIPEIGRMDKTQDRAIFLKADGLIGIGHAARYPDQLRRDAIESRELPELEIIFDDHHGELRGLRLVIAVQILAELHDVADSGRLHIFAGDGPEPVEPDPVIDAGPRSVGRFPFQILFHTHKKIAPPLVREGAINNIHQKAYLLNSRRYQTAEIKINGIA